MRDRRARHPRAPLATAIAIGLLLGVSSPAAADTPDIPDAASPEVSTAGTPAVDASTAPGRVTVVTPVQRGPEPNPASIAAPEGPLTYDQVQVVGSTTMGFARGDVSYPEARGTYALVAVMPGVVTPPAAVSWMGPYLASNGFVAVTIDPLGAFDGPTARADQLDAAIRWLTTAGPHAVRSRIDPARVGAVGGGFGGGATLGLAGQGPDAALLATVDLGPVQLDPARLDRPALDGTALAASPTGPVGRTDDALPWLKRHLDGDTRYDPFVCASAGTGVAAYPATCTA